MWLDELADLVRSLRERIEKQGDVLRKNESATRYALVDPVLRALGWDLENPSEVIPEYSPGKGYADYGMMVGRAKPRLIIEAKSLGTPTRQGIDQGITYCISQGIEYFAVTNGEVWEICEPHRPVPIDEKVITSFGLRSPEHETVLKMLWLWHGNFSVGQPAAPPDLPIAKLEPVAATSPPAGWIPLTDLHPRPGTEPRPPEAIWFPGAQSRPVTYWYHLQVRVVEWLVETKRLLATDCPVTLGKGAKGAHMVHTQAVKRNGKKFVYPEPVAGLWIDKSHDSKSNTYVAKKILKARGVDPATVHVLPRSD